MSSLAEVPSIGPPQGYEIIGEVTEATHKWLLDGYDLKEAPSGHLLMPLFLFDKLKGKQQEEETYEVEEMNSQEMNSKVQKFNLDANDNSGSNNSDTEDSESISTASDGNSDHTITKEEAHLTAAPDPRGNQGS